MSDLQGRVAVVTGAGSGIGEATARLFAARGAAVLVADVRPVATDVAASIIADGGVAKAIHADVSVGCDVSAMVAQAKSEFGRLDFAVNSAGVDVPHTPLAEGSEEDFDRIVDIDLKGVWRCMRAEIPVMLEGGGGAIVNISSMAGTMGVAGAAAYCAAKHGVIGLTRVAALDYAGKVRVNAITPGLVRTPFIDEVLGDRVDEFIAATPTGQIPDPIHVARAAVWLCSDDSAHVTGDVLSVK